MPAMWLRLLTIVMAALLLGAGSAGAGEVIRIRLGHVLADTHSWQLAAIGFAGDVRTGTQGRVDIQLFPFGQLGNEKELIEGLQLGTVQAAIVGSGSFQAVEPRMGILELPYAWPTRAAAFAALDGDLGDALERLLLARGIVALAWWENGYRHVTTRGRAIATVADLKRLRIRVTPDKVRFDTFRALGAEPAPLAFNELYSALQQGVFEAQENPLSVIYSSSLFEVQDRLALTAHNWSAATLVFAEPAWNAMSEADRGIVAGAAAKWAIVQRGMIADADAVLLDQLRGKGMTIEPVDIDAFRAAVAPVWEANRAEFGEDLFRLLDRYRGAPP